jgi:hypothetical protein
VVVASGHWQGHAWRLEASDDSSGPQVRHCYRVVVDFPFTTAAPPASPNCSALAVLPATVALPPNFPHGFSYSSFGVCPLAFIDGVTVKQATKVTVTLANGKSLTTTAVVPPPGLSQGVRYFASQIPCGSQVTKLVARSASGKQVGLFAIGPH